METYTSAYLGVGIATEELSPLEWPVDKSVGRFLD